ncbi:MAG TPA: response regulator [Candidatus Paceibacterota bacterium]|nr:response regulator [Candidatus Paceibacterota bacterium]
MEQFKSKKILVVEDEKDMRDVIVETLTEVGYPVVSAADAVEGMKLYHDEHPDLIVLDILMPGKTGLALLSDIRKEPGGDKVHVIMLTNYNPTNSNLIEPILKSNPEYYLIKSNISMDTLVDKVRSSFEMELENKNTPK